MARGEQKNAGNQTSRAVKAPAGDRAPPSGRRIEIFVHGVPLEVSPELEAAVERACNALQQPHPAEMTTTQAAEYLDVSRPFVIKLVKRGELPCRMVGKHRRIPTAALRQYKDKMFRDARKALHEMTAIAQELGLYDLEGPPPKP